MHSVEAVGSTSKNKTKKNLFEQISAYGWANPIDFRWLNAASNVAALLMIDGSNAATVSNSSWRFFSKRMIYHWWLVSFFFFYYLFIYLFIIIIFVEGNRSVSIELGSCRVFGLRSIPAEWCASYPNPMENANVKNVEPKQSDSKSTMILMMFNKRNVALLGAQVPSKSR